MNAEEKTDLPFTPSPNASLPPLLPWRAFADWIGMSSDHGIVEEWIRRGYIPSYKVGRYVMVNVALLNRQLLEREGL